MAAVMSHSQRWPVRGLPLVTPFHDGKQHILEISTFARQFVFVVAVLAGHPCQDIVIAQSLEPIGQHLFADSKTSTKLFESAIAAKHIAHDQQRPPFADDIERTSDGTVHVTDVCSLHCPMLVS